MNDSSIQAAYFSIIWFIVLALVWLTIFNQVKEYSLGLIIYIVILLMIIVISGLSYNNDKSEIWKGTAISGMIAHSLYILLAGYTLFTKNKSINTNTQTGGRKRRA